MKLDFSKTEELKPAKNNDIETLNVAVSAMTSPQETIHQYEELLNYLGEKIGRQINLRQRKTYMQVNELLINGDIDLAFICSGAYVAAKETGQIELLAIPVINDKPSYQSYLLVSSNSEAESVADLQGERFAYTDPLSLTGCLQTRKCRPKRPGGVA